MTVHLPGEPFADWLQFGLLQWLQLVGILAVAAVLFWWLVAVVRHGPISATRKTFRVLGSGVVDLFRISPRRVAALTWLAVKESIRRRVVVVFAVFIVVLLFAGWFLDPGSPHPGRLYLSFVLTATSYLLLLLALFLSALSLPADLKSKTLHTVVTKPVRPSEILLGRVLGFTALGTGLLLVMGTISYFFVLRGLDHTHELAAEDLSPVGRVVAGQPSAVGGRTARTHQHRHQVEIDAEGNAHVQMEQGHWHELSVDDQGDATTYRLGPPKGMLVARVPVYGRLAFKDRHGKDAEEGVNVGNEWSYRSYVQGGTLAAGVWTFDGITEERFSDGLPLELTIEVYRTHKGDTSNPDVIPPIPGSLSVRNPKTGKRVEAKIFEAKEFSTDVQFIPRKLQTPEGETVDLFDDLVADGKVEIWLRCVQPGQYFGAGRADLYLRARDASFPLNFAKGYLGIWLQMVLVIGIGVMFSTFLGGPIALVATMGVLIGGLLGDFMARLGASQFRTKEQMDAAGMEWVLGGGPAESAVRILTQKNMMVDLEGGLQTTVVHMVDKVMGYALWAASAVLPQFHRFSFAEEVAYGFDVAPAWLLRAGLQALAFLVPVMVAGYFFLKTREVAR